MARLRLRDTETRAKHLPQVCMACGAPSTDRIKKNFSWYPPWIGLLIFVGGIPLIVILAIVLSKRMTVDVPVCDRHRHYFRNRTLLALLAFIVPFVIGTAIFGITSAVADNGDAGAVFGLGCMAFVVLLIAAIIMLAVIQGHTIKPKEITDRSITLVKVHDGFVEAWEELRNRGASRTS